MFKVYLVYFVYFVGFVGLVGFVYLVDLVGLVDFVGFVCMCSRFNVLCSMFEVFKERLFGEEDVLLTCLF